MIHAKYHRNQSVSVYEVKKKESGRDSISIDA